MFYSVPEAAKLYRCHPETIRRICRKYNDNAFAFRLGCSWRIRKEAFDRLLDGKPVLTAIHHSA